MKKILALFSMFAMILVASSGVHAKNNYNISKITGGSTYETSAKISREKELFFVDKGYIKNNKKYIEGYFDKFVTDLDEARKYEKETGRIVVWNDGDGRGDYISDDGFDMPISNTVILEVTENVKIGEIDFDVKNGHNINVIKDFNSIIIGKYKSLPIFQITIKNGIVTEMCQVYRP